jgi:RimJ/RimL family protein N-acetyltransferase
MEVGLEPLNEKHAAISFKWRNIDSLWKYTFNRPDKIVTYEMELDWIRNVLKNENEKRYAIIANSEYVGNIYLTSISNGKSFFGIFIGEENVRGKGVARMAMEKLFHLAKNTFEIKEIYLRVKKENTDAIRLYLKMTFSVHDEHLDFYLLKKEL